LLRDEDEYVRSEAASALRTLMSQGIRFFPGESGRWEFRDLSQLEE